MIAKVIKLPNVGHARASAIEDAQCDLQYSIDDLFEAAKLFAENGDKLMAQRVVTHAHALQALLILRTS